MPSGPCMVDAATTEPRLTIGPTERSMPPVSMTMVSAAATIAVGNQPWTNLAIAPTDKMPGNKNRVDHREHGEDEEQRAEAFVAPPLDRPIESRSLTRHQTASPCSVDAFRTPMAAATIASSDASACGRVAATLPLLNTMTRSQRWTSSGVSRAEQDDGFALGRHCAQRKVDLALGLDVDAAGRIIQEQDRRLERQPFRQRDLLLVAAGQRLGRPPPVASNIEALRQTFGDRVLLRSPATLGAVAGEQRQEQIEVDRVRAEAGLPCVDPPERRRRRQRWRRRPLRRERSARRRRWRTRGTRRPRRGTAP